MILFDMDSREDYLLDGKYKVATPYAPCVDVVKVVRCKDCLWYEPKYMDREYDCPQGLYGVYEDDFCSHAERREE